MKCLNIFEMMRVLFGGILPKKPNGSFELKKPQGDKQLSILPKYTANTIGSNA